MSALVDKLEVETVEESVPGANQTGSAAPRPVPGAGADATGSPAKGERLPLPGDDRLAARIARADRYFREHLRGQRDWYSQKATIYKARGEWLGFIVVTAGALTIFLQTLHSTFSWPWMVILISILGTVVALAKSIERIGRYEDIWLSYRKASEEMKREYRLYVNAAGQYADLTDEDGAYRQFVASIEIIIAEEQQIYWVSRQTTAVPAPVDNKWLNTFQDQIRPTIEHFFTPPPLSNFSGYVAVDLITSDGSRILTTNDDAFQLEPGRRYAVPLQLQQSRPAWPITREVKITGGIDSDVVSFHAVIDSDVIEFDPKEADLIFSRTETFATALFKFSAPREVTLCEAWVTILQSHRTIQVVHLTFDIRWPS